MSDGEALLAAILSHPEEDAPRMIFADWLDENNQHDRAEFIRVQVLQPARQRVHSPDCPRRGLDLSRLRLRDVELRGRACTRCRLETFGLPGRFPWGRAAVRPWFDWPGPARLTHSYIDRAKFARPGVLPNTLDALFGRGFVAAVCCDLGTWLKHGPSLVKVHPVTEVHIDGTAIIWSGDATYCYAAGIGSFPKEYRAALDRQPDEQAARESLNRVALEWAKAGMPTDA